MTSRRFGPYTVETTNEDKILFPDAGITKGALIDYYVGMAGTVLRHLADRPLTMQRFPDGIRNEGFYQKEVPSHAPDWIDPASVKTADGEQVQVVCPNAATLAWLGQLACITPHVWLSRRDALDRPDRLVLDLDPAGNGFAPVREAARAARRLLRGLDLPAFPMTTGSRGIHLVVPLDRREDFGAVRAFAKSFAEELERRHAAALTTEQRRDRRGERVYLDTSNNAYGQTVVSPYAVRALPGAPVAVPIEWSELGDARLNARRWTLGSVPHRPAQRDDPWKGIARHGRSLADARRRLSRTIG